MTTDAASAITAGGASFNETLNPENQGTSYHFDYGSSTAYGSRVPASDAAVGSGRS